MRSCVHACTRVCSHIPERAHAAAPATAEASKPKLVARPGVGHVGSLQCALCTMPCTCNRILRCSGSTADCQAAPSSVLLYGAAAAGTNLCLAVGAASSDNGAKVQVGGCRGGLLGSPRLEVAGKAAC